MIWPGRPRVVFAIETILLPAGRRKLTSKINKAPAVIANQQKNRKKMELVMPTSAVETGRASIPPPIEVPTISNIPPMSLELAMLDSHFNCLKLNQYDTKKYRPLSIHATVDCLLNDLECQIQKYKRAYDHEYLTKASSRYNKSWRIAMSPK